VRPSRGVNDTRYNVLEKGRTGNIRAIFTFPGVALLGSAIGEVASPRASFGCYFGGNFSAGLTGIGGSTPLYKETVD